MNQLPPIEQELFSNEAETALLASVLIDPTQYSVASMHIDSPQAFFLIRHQRIWESFGRLRESGTNLDMITVADDLEAHGILEDIGGRAYLVKLSNSMGTSVHASVYAELVVRLHVRRKILKATDHIRALAMDTTINIDEVQGASEDALLSAYAERRGAFGGWSREIMSELYDEFEAMLVHRHDVPGVPTGIDMLDKLMFGMEPEQLSIWAGRPGMGKTSTFISIVYNRCKAGDMVLVFSSEMSRKQLIRRLWAIVSGVPLARIKNPRVLSAEERRKLTNAMKEVADYKLYIDDTPEPKPAHVRSMTKLYKERHNIQYILVDGIYKMKPNHKHESQSLSVGSISSDLREIARSFGIHVAATHQLNRGVENRSDKRPMLSDLRDSGELEQDADKVIFLYRDEIYNEATEFPSQIDFIVAKHRDGGTGVASAYFDKARTLVCNGSIERVDLGALS